MNIEQLISCNLQIFVLGLSVIKATRILGWGFIGADEIHSSLDWSWSSDRILDIWFFLPSSFSYWNTPELC